MIISKVLVAIFGLTMGVLGGVTDMPTAAAAHVISEPIVTVSGASGILADY
jgi:hypothetical protein